MRFNQRFITFVVLFLTTSFLAVDVYAQGKTRRIRNNDRDQDRDEDISSRSVGGSSVAVASPDLVVVLPKTSSRGALGAEINVEVADVKVEVDESKSEEDDPETSIRQIDAEGDLAAVALDVARSYLYVNSPDTDVATRGISGVGKTSATPTTSNTVDGPKWRYDVRIDSFKQYRKPDSGEAALAVDATLNIVDENGKPLLPQPRSYHNPPLDQRMTDEEIEKKISKKKSTGKLLGSVAEGVGGLLGGGDRGSQQIANTAGQVFSSIWAHKAAELEANYTSTETVVKEYQWQESAVRSAVRSLMDQAPTPSGGMSYGLEYSIKDPGRLRGADDDEEQAFERGLKEYELGAVNDAFATWLEIGDTDTEPILYNQAIGELRNAAQLTQSNPAAAYAAVDRAYDKLLDASGEYGDDEARLYKQVSDLRKALEPYKGTETAVVSSAPSSTDTTDIKPPTKPSSKFALLIGIGQFEDSTVSSLSAAPRDVDTMKSALLKSGFKESNIIALKNESATLQGIRNAINEIGQRVDENSLLVVSVSSHGSSPADNDPLYKEGFIFCHDSNLNELFATAYPIIDFREHLDRRIRCQQKIIFQDTCHSGAGHERLSGTRIEFVQWPPYMAIFAAAQANQFSVETGGNGIFTKTLADYIIQKDGKVTVSELHQHLAATVPKLASDVNHQQNPQLFTGPGAETIVLN